MFFLFCFFFSVSCSCFSFFFFFNDTATTEIYTLSLHDALPIWSVLEAVRRVPGLRVGITTKSPAVTRDLELLRAIAASGELIVNVSIASTDAALLRRIEPRAPRPDLRLAAMAQLTAAGVATRLFAMPVLPYLTDGEAEMEALFHAAREAGAREAI